MFGCHKRWLSCSPSSLPIREIFQLSLAAAIVLCACGCPAKRSPIQRALDYLDAAQVKHDSSEKRKIDYRGNWPQVFHFRNVQGYRIDDVSPFVVVFAHHALATITPATRDALGLSETDLQSAQDMRVCAVECLNRFKSDDSGYDAGAFGFWPYDNDVGQASTPLEGLLLEVLKGPVLGGTRAPINLSYFPSGLAVPADADVTATVYAALLDHQSLDDGPAVTVDIETLFGANRHIDDVLMRFSPAWLNRNSGAYLTWFMDHGPGAQQYGNDVDLVVNANILFALARYGLHDAAGFSETAALLNESIANGLHRTHWDEISLYYPDSYVFHYCVSRAFAEGPVPELENAAAQLAAEIVDEAHRCDDGTAYWDKGHRELNTAFAVLSLINAGSSSPLIDEGVAYLERTQNPVTGAWDEAPFFIARADSGIVIEWESAPLTTAIALEAFCKARLRAAQ